MEESTIICSLKLHDITRSLEDRHLEGPSRDTMAFVGRGLIEGYYRDENNCESRRTITAEKIAKVS